MAVTNPFTHHPHSTGELLPAHAGRNRFARQTIGAGMCALVHAIFPMFHQTTASERIQCLAACIESGDRGAITIVRPPDSPPATTLQPLPPQANSTSATPRF